jgi:hypothetical protein
MRRAAIAQGVMSNDVPDVATDPAFATAWYHLMVWRPLAVLPYRVDGVTFFDAPSNFVLFHRDCIAPGAKKRVERRPLFAVGALSTGKYAKVLQHALRWAAIATLASGVGVIVGRVRHAPPPLFFLRGLFS